MYTELIGKPYKAYATGLDYFDCWGLVVYVLREQFGIADVPRHLDVTSGDSAQFSAAVEHEQAGGLWVPLDGPKNGAVVLMARGRLFNHCGVCVDGLVLNCRMGAGVCIDSLAVLKKSLGFQKFQYYAHKNLK